MHKHTHGHRDREIERGGGYSFKILYRGGVLLEFCLTSVQYGPFGFIILFFLSTNPASRVACAYSPLFRGGL